MIAGHPATETGEGAPVTVDDELSNEQYEVADRIEAALERTPEGLTPSAAARAARTDYATALAALQYMVAHLYAHTSGNGAWTRYHAGRAA